MEISPVPSKAQILVIGGGPAGSYAATALAREGFQVVLLEATKFPRYHIGESLIPSVRLFLKFIGAEDTVKSYGFTVKPGAAIKLNQFKQEGYTDFIAMDRNNMAWNVIRAEFDDILLKHAAQSGVAVFQETRVTELQFKDDRPVSATYVSRSGVQGQVEFDYLVDASGRNGIVSTKYLRNRRFNKILNNIAYWGYWEGAGCYKPGTARENAIWVEALPDESGWAWFIPLHDGSTSVGIVMDQETSTSKKKEAGNGSEESSLQAHYLQEVCKVPGLMKLLGNAILRNSGQPGAIKSASDYSYVASSYAGSHYRIAGDAGAFIDPFFSSGVHLALIGGLSAAITISASIRGFTTEVEAQRWHTSKVESSYTGFLLVVLGSYKQIRNQTMPVLSNADEDNFDRAFDLIRPIIQGMADVGKTHVKDELQKATDFCRHILAPMDPKMHMTVSKRLAPELTSQASQIVTEAELDALLDRTDQEARHVLRDINARRQLQMSFNTAQDFDKENHFGFKAVLQRGRLGLVSVEDDGDKRIQQGSKVQRSVYLEMLSAVVILACGVYVYLRW